MFAFNQARGATEWNLNTSALAPLITLTCLLYIVEIILSGVITTEMLNGVEGATFWSKVQNSFYDKIQVSIVVTAVMNALLACTTFGRFLYIFCARSENDDFITALLGFITKNDHALIDRVQNSLIVALVQASLWSTSFMGGSIITAKVAREYGWENGASERSLENIARIERLVVGLVVVGCLAHFAFLFMIIRASTSVSMKTKVANQFCNTKLLRQRWDGAWAAVITEAITLAIAAVFAWVSSAYIDTNLQGVAEEYGVETKRISNVTGICLALWSLLLGAFYYLFRNFKSPNKELDSYRIRYPIAARIVASLYCAIVTSSVAIVGIVTSALMSHVFANEIALDVEGGDDLAKYYKATWWRMLSALTLTAISYAMQAFTFLKIYVY